jgi:hypothetical protein
LKFEIWNLKLFSPGGFMTLFRDIKVTSLIILSLFILACSTGGQPVLSGGPDIEGLLVQAGFVKNPADTPEKLARVRAEVQRKVVPVREVGQVYYIYADADFCRCLYVGDEPAFRRFEDLMRMENLQRNSCIDDRLRSTQAEPWREFGTLGDLCRGRP